MQSRVSHMRSEGVMGAVGELAAVLVGTVVHDEAVSRTVLYLVVWSGVRARGVGRWELGLGYGKGVLRTRSKVSSIRRVVGWTIGSVGGALDAWEP